MIRKQLYLEPRQQRLLKRLARERGVPEAEIVRRALDAFAPDLAQRAAEWDREVAYMYELQRQTPPPISGDPNDRGWTRDSVYEGRLSRHERRSH